MTFPRGKERGDTIGVSAGGGDSDRGGGGDVDGTGDSFTPSDGV